MPPKRPQKPILNVHGIPASMKSQRRWVPWRYKYRDGCYTKVPVRVNPDGTPIPLDVRNPAHWLTFEEARAHVEQGRADGVGFVLGGGWAALDLDACRVPHTGSLEPWAEDLVRRLDTYTEVSPSGTGLKLILHCSTANIKTQTIPNAFLTNPQKPTQGMPFEKEPEVRLLAEGTFTTVTGDHVPGTPPEPQERTRELRDLLRARERLGAADGPPAPMPDDRTLGRHAKAALRQALEHAPDRQKFAKRFRACFAPHMTDDRSGTAYAVACLLVDHGVREPMQIASVVALSKPHRDKFAKRPDRWEDAWRCATRALEGVRETMSTKPAEPSALSPMLRLIDDGRRTRDRRPQLARLADVQPENVHWLWYPYIPLGKLTILEGDPGAGKTWLALWVTAAVTRGEPLPGPATMLGERREPANVLYLSAEDGLADTLRPRLDAVGANSDRVFALTGWTGTDEHGQEGVGGITLQDLDVLEAALTECSPALVVVDPLQAYIGPNVDLHRANEVRSVLHNVAKLAERHGCAVVLVRHLAKSSTERAIYRGLGSIDFAAAARSILLLAQDPEDDSGQRRVVAHVKSSLAEKGPSLAFSIREGQFIWEGTVEADAEALLAPRTVSEEGRRVLDEAIAFLRDLLADGPVPAKDVERARKEAGFSRGTIFRAKFELGIQVRKVGKTWQWFPPQEPMEHMEQLEQLNERRSSGAGSSSVPSVPTVPAPNGMAHLDARRYDGQAG